MTTATTETEPHEAVRGIIEEELADLHGMWEGAAAQEHNVFLKAISPQLAIGSKLSRQLTSRMGRKLHAMARGVAELRFGPERVPRDLLAHGVDVTPREHDDEDTHVFSNVNYQRMMSLANELVDRANTVAKIGTDEWRELYHDAIDELHDGRRQEQPWSVQVDLAVLDQSVGFAEVESGGELDSSNAPAQTRKLVRAGLSYGVHDMPLHFCTAYANRGEGRPIKGSLRSYILQEPDHRDGLLTGSNWWNRILPPPLDFDDFLEIFHEVAEEYEIAGPAH